MNKHNRLNFREFFIFIDFFVLNIALVSSFLINETSLSCCFELFIIANFAAVFILVFFSFDKYSQHTRISNEALTALKKGILVALLFAVSSMIYLHDKDIVQLFIVFIIFYLPALSIFHGVAVYIIKKLRARGFFVTPIAIAGYGDNAKELITVFKNNNEWGYQLNGVFGDDSGASFFKGDITKLKAFCSANNISEIFCCLPHVSKKQLEEIIDFSDELLIKVWIIPSSIDFGYKNYGLARMEHIPLINIEPIPLEKPVNLIMKRIFDVLFSLMITVGFLWWIFIILGFLIKIDSPGPVFFIQKRTGIGGKSFRCFKLRTMKVNKEADTLQASKNDQRITTLGRFLRKTSLDELPQFINVLKGDMSVIGPRPHMIAHTEKYTAIIEKYMYRHKIKPGITGLAQVKGFRGGTEEDDYAMKGRVRLDRFYIQNWSLGLDLKILFLTILKVFKPDHHAF